MWLYLLEIVSSTCFPIIGILMNVFLLRIIQKTATLALNVKSVLCMFSYALILDHAGMLLQVCLILILSCEWFFSLINKWTNFKSNCEGSVRALGICNKWCNIPNLVSRVFMSPTSQFTGCSHSGVLEESGFPNMEARTWGFGATGTGYNRTRHCSWRSAWLESQPVVD